MNLYGYDSFSIMLRNIAQISRLEQIPEMQLIAVLILGHLGIPHLAIGQVLSGICAKECSQPGGSEKLLCKLSRKTNPNMGTLRIDFWS